MTLRSLLPVFIGLLVLTVTSAVLPAIRAAGLIYRVSVGSGGIEGDSNSTYASITPDGRFVVFHSTATTLIPGDTNAGSDVFVYDRLTGETSRVSVSSQGEEGNGNSSSPSVNADGDIIAFDSTSTNFAPGDTNETNDIFLHKRSSGETFLVSSAYQTDLPANALSTSPAISSNGNVVAFTSYASNLIADDLNEAADIFVRSLTAPDVRRVSVSSEGVEANGVSGSPVLNADGTVIAFTSDATNLIPGDTNGVADIFVHNLASGATVRISVSDTGRETDAASQFPSISADGNLIAFVSYATNLVPDDTNAYCDLDYDGRYEENCPDVFVYQMDTGTIRRVNVSPLGTEADGDTLSAAISPDGTYVAFQSIARNLVEGDANAHYDIFLKSLQSGEVTLTSIADSGAQGDGDSAGPSVSLEARVVSFSSSATNLVSNDTNGSFDVFAYERELPPAPTPTATPRPMPTVTLSPTESPFENTLYLPAILLRNQCNGTETEPNNGFSNANDIGACKGQVVTGSFPDTLPTDAQDVYRLALTSPGTLTITLSNIPTGNNYELALYGEDRDLLADSRLEGNSAERIVYTLEPGFHMYYIQIYRLTGYSDGAYELLWLIN